MSEKPDDAVRVVLPANVSEDNDPKYPNTTLLMNEENAKRRKTTNDLLDTLHLVSNTMRSFFVAIDELGEKDPDAAEFVKTRAKAILKEGNVVHMKKVIAAGKRALVEAEAMRTE